MDFDDLDETERELGPMPEEQRAELLKSAKAEVEPLPVPDGKHFGSGKKMKMLFMHGGGTNEKCSKMQILNIFQNTYPGSEWKDMMEFDVWSGPHKVPLEWHAAPEMRDTLSMYGPDYWLYWDFDPPYNPNAQHCNWIGYDETMEKLGEFLKENGPYDGLTGFDEGAACAFQAALRAQQGDPAFASMFRFMVLFTTYLPTVSSPLAARRPEAMLSIPTFISWSEADHSRPWPVFEEIALFFDEDLREIVRHSQGHIPPAFRPGMEETKLLKDFLHCMDTGLRFVPAKTHDNSEFSGLFLPIVRVEARELEADTDKKLLIFYEPDSGKRAFKEAASSAPHEAFRCRLYADVAAATPEDFKKAAEGVSDDSIEIISFDYSEEHKNIVFEQPRANLPKQILSNMDPQDVITDDSSVLKAREVGSSLLETVSLLPGDNVGIVGIGHGALIALQAARELINGRSIVPAMFWAVNAPTVLPASLTCEGPGLLVDCPLRYLISQKSLTGAPWRWEIQTFGPFSTGLFESRENMCQMVLQEFRSR